MKKKSLILFMLILLLLSTAEQTVCYLTNKTEDKPNPFTAGSVTVTVEETFTGKIKSNVQVANTGKSPAYIRVRAVPGWYNADGTMAPVPVEGTYSLTVGDGWIYSGGYYYCTSVVNPLGSTSVLFEEVKPSDNLNESYNGLKFHFDVLADAIQAKGTDDSTGNPIVVLAWGVNPENM